MEPKKQWTSIDQYIHSFPSEVQNVLQTIRKTIQEAAPEAVEAISYQMPTFKLQGKNLVHFAAWKEHIGFYPTPRGLETFEKELATYNGAKGSVQFPLTQPMPLELIKKIVQFRVEDITKSNKKS